jgi:hypothetical protein
MRPHPTLAALLLSLLVVACGGGGDDAGTGPDDRVATSASANGVIVAGDSVHAQSVVLATARTVIASGQASQLVTCAGGGSAIFSASGGSGGSLGNGLLDTGEVYSIDFFGCRSSSGSARVTGELTLTVNAASGPDHSVTTDTDLTVELPRRVLSFDGSSTLTHTEVSNGPTHVVTDRWTAASISVTSFRNGRYTRLSLTNVDLTHRVTTTNGTVTDVSDEGRLTMSYDGWAGHWSATISTEGLVRFNVDGVPLSGLWRIALPHQLVMLEVMNEAARATLPGRVLLWPILVLASLAD